MRRHIMILGAGIGGLTTAIALHKRGVRSVLYEAAGRFHNVGGGLMLAHNGMQVMTQLGLRAEVEAAGYKTHAMRLTDASLSAIRETAFEAIDREFGGLSHVAIARARLHDLLRQQLGDTAIVSNKRCIHVSSDAHGATATFADGERVEADVLIAADGVNSVTRRSLVPELTPRFGGQAAWIGVAHMAVPQMLAGAVTEAWGPEGSRVIIVPLKADEIYWVAVTRAEHPHESVSRSYADLAALLQGCYHPLLTELLSHTDPACRHQYFLQDLRNLDPWHVGRTVFLGDAAHATTPNLGQGANQAMEDGLVLAEALTTSESPEAAFASYHRRRRNKTRDVIDMSRRWGQMAHWQRPWLCSVRNACVAALPAASDTVALRRLARL